MSCQPPCAQVWCQSVMQTPAQHLQWRLLSCLPRSNHAHCCLTAGMYFVYKGTLLSKSATVLFAAVRAVVRREAAFGVFAKPEEIMETGNQCAICQVGRPTLLHAPSAQRRAAFADNYGTCPCKNCLTLLQDAPTAAIKLPCSHIFCQRCLSEWAERQHTCPMCRSSIKPMDLRSYADGSTTLLPSLW